MDQENTHTASQTIEQKPIKKKNLFGRMKKRYYLFLFVISMVIIFGINVVGKYERMLNAAYVVNQIGVFCRQSYLWGADKDTFKVIDGGPYAKDSDSVYYGCRKIQGADPITFQYLGSKFKSNGERPLGASYAKDKSHAYLFGSRIEGVDLATFVYIGGRYAKDKKNIFYNDYSYGYYENGKDGRTLDVDVVTFQYLGGEYTKDKNDTYYKNFPIGGDLSTFQYVDGEYAKDKNNVYEFGGVYIKKAIDPSTLQSLGEGFVKDKNNVYYSFGFEIVKGVANPAAVYPIGKGFFRDTDNIYYRMAGKIEGADLATFEVLDEGYSKDKNNVYYFMRKISSLDVQYLGGNYIKDNLNVYRYGKKIEGADPASFKYIGDDRYAKDLNHVYIGDSVIRDADPNSFEYVGGAYSKDKFRVYYYGRYLKWANPAKCTISTINKYEWTMLLNIAFRGGI